MVLIGSDLDGTLVGDPAAQARFAAAIAPVRRRITLAYVSGRSYGQCLRACEGENALPAPDVWISSIGTEVYFGDTLDQAWKARMEEGWNRRRLVELAATLPQIGPHPDPLLQTPWRIIYHVDPDQVCQVSRRLRDLAAAEGIRAQFIFSHGIELDIVPEAGNKGRALAMVAQRLGVDAAQVIGCGDSGNDISLLEAAGRGIIVANAQAELLQWRQEHPGTCCLTRGRYADGVVEGLRQYGVLNTPAQ